MHQYLKAAIDLKTAEEDLKSTIERIADECNIVDMSIKLYAPSISFFKVVGSTAVISMNENGIIDMKPLFSSIPIADGWDIFLTELKKELEK